MVLRPLTMDDAAAHLAGEDSEFSTRLRGGVRTEETVRRHMERSQVLWRDGGAIFAFAICHAENTTAPEEGYALEVDNGVRITACTATGVYWGTRSLLHMLSASTTLPAGTATDWPHYPVRGFMLDVGRRFARPEALHDYIRFLS